MKDQVELLCQLALYGSPAARAIALVFLDELSGGQLLDKLKKLVRKEGITDGNNKVKVY